MQKWLGLEFYVWYADQTSINFEILPHRTLNSIGMKTIWIESARKENEYVVFLLIDYANRQSKHFVILKANRLPHLVSNHNSNSQNVFSAKV